jgi:hypothetical protein
MITCHSCGALFEEYKTAEKIFKNGTKHIEARCPLCDKWIKYLPQENFIMPFGKYKGMDIDEVARKDLDYIRWLEENTESNSIRNRCLSAIAKL